MSSAGNARRRKAQSGKHPRSKGTNVSNCSATGFQQNCQFAIRDDEQELDARDSRERREAPMLELVSDV